MQKNSRRVGNSHYTEIWEEDSAQSQTTYHKELMKLIRARRTITGLAPAKKQHWNQLGGKSPDNGDWKTTMTGSLKRYEISEVRNFKENQETKQQNPKY